MEDLKINWFLEHVKSKKHIEITKSPFHIGRAENMDLICRSVNVSRNHADILVYIDGSLHVKENKAVNGTYINRRLINSEEIATINEGDEVGFGAHSGMVLGTVKSMYIYIAKKKVLQNNNLENEPNISSTNQQLQINIKEADNFNGKKPIINAGVNESTSTSSVCTIEDVKKVIKTEIEDFIPLPTESKSNVPDFSVDECIVISDSESDIVEKSNKSQTFSDTIFCNIKKELEDLDKYEDYIPTYGLHNDLQFDDDDIFSNIEYNENAKDVNNKTVHDQNPNGKIITNIQSASTNSTSTAAHSVPNLRKRKTFEIPPIVPPHFEKNLETINKHKSTAAVNIEQIKKMRSDNFYNSKLKEDSKRNIPTENIHETRKRKLKEIAEKSHNGETKTKSSRAPIAKVKLSDGRGKFLETPCDIPSTSKVRLNASKCRKKLSPTVKKPDLNSKVSSNNSATGDKAITVISTSSKPLVPNNISLLPSSYSKKVNKQTNGYRDSEHALLLKDVEDVILEMLTWKVSWFYEHHSSDKLPQLRKEPLKRMNKSFMNYMEYYKIVIPLLLVEVWTFLYKNLDFDFKNQPIIYFNLEKETIRDRFLELDCLTQMPKDRICKEGDIIVMQLYPENVKCEAEPHKLAVLGYVTYVNKKNLVTQDIPSSSKNKSAPIINVYVRIIIQRLDGKFDKSGKVRPFFQHLTSFISSARTIRSIKYLEKSPLCQHVLRPSIRLYKIPSAPKQPVYLKNELNQAQLEAVSEASNLCLNKRPNIYLIHGPPGTGKTTVIINIIFSVIFDDKFKGSCILVTAPTNAAVDELAIRIIAAKNQLPVKYRNKVDMVRIGPRNAIRAEVLDYSLYEGAKRTLFRDLLKHESIENRRKLKEIKEKIDYWKTQHNMPSVKEKIKSATIEFEEFCRDILGRAYNERISQYESTLVKGARIICTTLSSCASVIMEKIFSREPGKIRCCIVDEATQSTEQETLIPLTLGVDKLILVGDPKQLPALSFAQESKSYGFGQSLFSRIDENFKGAAYNPIKFLNTQYRMHPSVCSFPNQEFYEGKLKNATILFSRKSPLNKLQPYLVFHFQGDTDNTEEYRNKSEILCVILLLEAIVSKIPDTCNFSVGIITPYNDQKDGILESIRKKTFRRNVEITVNTVDSFQGRENDIIIMSCVRYHANNFLSDEQRLNVALTRARFALYIIGSTNLFMSCSKFGKIRKDSNSRKLLKNLDTRMPLSAINKMIFTE